MLAGCASVAVPSSVVVRRDFASERYCPIERVAAAEVDRTPPPSPAIARDPERLAMWRAAAKRRVGGTHLIDARGCDERAVYVCRDEIIGERRGHGSWVAGRGARHRRRNVEISPVCLEQGITLERAAASRGEGEASVVGR
jgi:hypothetical protein